MPLRKFGILVVLLASACGGEPVAEPEGCPYAEPGRAALGAFDAGYVPAGPELILQRGAQGGCHLALALATSGLPGTRVTVELVVDDDETGATALTTRQVVRLQEASTGCVTGEVRAILARPWDLEDHPITVTATVTDERDRRFFDDLEAVVRWPAPVEGVPRELLCGPRS